MKKIIILLTSLILLLCLTSCSEISSLPNDNQPNIDEEQNILEKHAEINNIRIFDDYLDDIYYENGSLYTIDLQRKTIGETFLTSSYSFDITEQDGKLYLKENCYSYILLIELSELQLEKILSHKDIDEVVYSFEIKDIYPTDSYFYPESETDISYYVQIAVDHRVVLGACKDIYEITSY